MSVRLFIDTEFNGFGGELMSMALVSDDGREWYKVLPEPRIYDKWVFENVLPILDAEPVSKEEFHLSLKVFLEQFDQPTIYADWYTDLAHFFNAMAGSDHLHSFSKPCTAILLDDVPELENPRRHNALADARALRDWFMAERRWHDSALSEGEERG
ncbi:hypothetical protein [Mesorhizobium sp. BE184]|uniref:hypothetical protein n=1 Tax=Mesorhizobium sp. BE184 TaxID=2817714 RepID=UPI00285AD504|nr:hypothetical protein [Mesorhizobium sp. BE184]MDR7032417.1 hypothetical protein [Mesorhizobium sp. BE184]